MQKIIVQDRQTLLDVAVQYFGSADATIEIAQINAISPSELLEAGKELLLPNESENEHIAIGNYYKKNNLLPATALSDYDTQIINNDDPCDICKYFK